MTSKEITDSKRFNELKDEIGYDAVRLITLLNTNELKEYKEASDKVGEIISIILDMRASA